MKCGHRAPPAKVKFGLNYNFSEELLKEDEKETDFPEPFHINGLGVPFRQVGDSACPPFMSSSAVTRLRSSWAARSSDVFLVLPGGCPEPLFSNYINFVAALVEQLQLETVDEQFPRYIDAAVSRRGWNFVDYLDTIGGRRVMWTHSPPNTFPCSNGGFEETHSSSPSKVSSSDGPRVIVLVADPRVMVMRELHFMNIMMRGLSKDPFAGETTRLSRVLESVLTDLNVDSQQEFLELQPHDERLFFHGAIRNTAEWAEIEACHPDRVRLVFIEDFASDPDVAVAGIMSFLEISPLSYVSQELVQKSCDVPTMYSQQGQFDLGIDGTDRSFKEEIRQFEIMLENGPAELEGVWQKFLGMWTQSPHPRLAAWARAASEHETWNPAKWWAVHSARKCRPCLFFPRGLCDSMEECRFCHGEHHKPKRPRANKRKSKQRKYDRTPSPNGCRIEDDNAYN